VTRSVPSVFHSPFALPFVPACIDRDSFHPIPLADPAFAVHIALSRERLQASFCPTSEAAIAQIDHAISVVNALFPFLPRSLFVRRDSCDHQHKLHIVEITSSGGSAVANWPKLYPAYRFAVTAESVEAGVINEFDRGWNNNGFEHEITEGVHVNDLLFRTAREYDHPTR
jgi:hypothetical protein